MLTNSVPVAMELSATGAVELLLSGGQVRAGDAACYGAQADAFFEQVYADKAFLGSGGVHAEAGLTDYYPHEVAARRVMIAHAGACYVLADSSKLGNVAVHRVCALTQVTAVITNADNSKASQEAADALAAAGCTCCAPPRPRDRETDPPAMEPDPWIRSPRGRRRAQQFGYRQQFTRSLRQFESFAVAFSFISITTGIFTTYAFALAVGGTRSVWTWLIVVVGQALVALLYGALSSRIPLSGFSYQWASRLASPQVGWWFGWMSFAFLTIVTVSVDYGLIQVAFQPLIGEAYTPTSAALETLVVLALQAALIITSTRVTTRVNNTAVATEIIGIVGLTVLLLIVAAVRGRSATGPT